MEAPYREDHSRRAVAAFFGDDPTFEENEAAERALRAGLEWVSLTRGQRLFQQGDPGDALYIVVNGRLRALLEPPGAPPRALNEIGRGELVGEIAVITGQPRSATVEAIRDAELVRLSKTSFDALVEAHPRAMMRIVRTLILRLQRQERRAGASGLVSNLAIVPAGDGAPLLDLAARIVAGLGADGPALLLTRDRVDEALGAGAADAPAGGEAHSRVVAWLSEQEARHRRLVYVADDVPSEWTRRCVRQADRLLLVADAAGATTLHAVERVVAGAADGIVPRQDLVLLHPPGRSLAGTAAWLAGRTIAAHYHVRADVAADFDRMIRRLTGRAVGLVLGGGGARGLAHVGVMRALDEAGVAVDALGGASVGALVGALHAVGCSAEEILAGHGLGPGDPALLLGGLLSGHGTYRYLRRKLGDRAIEDLPVPFAAATVNITRGEIHHHRRGELARAVLASNAVPGVLPPVSYDGELHVDGGMLDNVPIDAVAPLVEDGPIVAVDVVPNTELRAAVDYPPGVAGYAMLWNRLNPLQTTHVRPGIQQVLNRAIEVAGAYQQRGARLRAGDLYLHPPLEEFGFADSKRAHELAERGYQYARERIAVWRAQ